MGARPVTRLRPPAGSAEPAAHPTMLLKGRGTADRVVRPRRHRFSTDFRSSGDHNSVENAIPRVLPLPEHPSSRDTPGRTCRTTNDALEDDRTRPSRRARRSDPHFSTGLWSPDDRNPVENPAGRELVGASSPRTTCPTRPGSAAQRPRITATLPSLQVTTRRRNEIRQPSGVRRHSSSYRPAIT